jgi:hypothetical protein
MCHTRIIPSLPPLRMHPWKEGLKLDAKSDSCSDSADAKGQYLTHQTGPLWP